MEHAPLRPVPGRPSGPVSDADAVALVASALPALSEREQVALALVALAAKPRPQVALRLGTDEAALSECLARARKELRRTLAPLPGSGWCERSERLISDRMDGVLAERDRARLDVHLRNCPRCVEHERRLVAATDALVAGVAPAPSAPVLLLPAAEPSEAKPAAAASPAPGAAEHPSLPARLAAWNVLLVIAIVLALACVALALAGVLSVDL
jgi:hypothetical protein